MAGLSPVRQRRQSRVPRQVRPSEYKRKEQARRLQGQRKPRQGGGKRETLHASYSQSYKDVKKDDTHTHTLDVDLLVIFCILSAQGFWIAF